MGAPRREGDRRALRRRRHPHFSATSPLSTLEAGIAGALDIDARGSRMEIVNGDTIVLRGVTIGRQTYWGELRWNPDLNVFALTGHHGLEGWNAHPPLPTPGDWSASAVWNNRLYVIGGGGRYDAVEVYDPASRVFEILGKSRRPPLRASSGDEMFTRG